MILHKCCKVLFTFVRKEGKPELIMEWRTACMYIIQKVIQSSQSHDNVHTLHVQNKQTCLFCINCKIKTTSNIHSDKLSKKYAWKSCSHCHQNTRMTCASTSEIAHNSWLQVSHINKISSSWKFSIHTTTNHAVGAADTEVGLSREMLSYNTHAHQHT